jgi:hypothetical protein
MEVKFAPYIYHKGVIFTRGKYASVTLEDKEIKGAIGSITSEFIEIYTDNGFVRIYLNEIKDMKRM